jgi:hypothetical protein
MLLAAKLGFAESGEANHRAEACGQKAEGARLWHWCRAAKRAGRAVGERRNLQVESLARTPTEIAPVNIHIQQGYLGRAGAEGSVLNQAINRARCCTIARTGALNARIPAAASNELISRDSPRENNVEGIDSARGVVGNHEESGGTRSGNVLRRKRGQIKRHSGAGAPVAAVSIHARARGGSRKTDYVGPRLRHPQGSKHEQAQ